MTTASKLQALVDGLEDTRQAIEDKGAALPAGSPLGDYPEAVESIEGGGGGGTEIPFRSLLTMPGDTDPWHLTSLTATSLAMYAFYGDTFLTSVSLPSATTINTYAFRGCSALTTVSFPAATTINTYAFQSCTSLTTADFPAASSINTYAFNNCTSLTTADFPAASSIATNVFQGCTSLTSLTLSRTRVAFLSAANAFRNTPIENGTGHIYVPDDLVDQYKTTTNWSTYANQILPLSQRP